MQRDLRATHRVMEAVAAIQTGPRFESPPGLASLRGVTLGLLLGGMGWLGIAVTVRWLLG